MAEWGQAVFDLGGNGGVDGAKNQAVGLERLERLGKHLFADAANRAGELREPVGAIEQDEEDERAPARGDMIEDDAGGTVGITYIALATALAGGEDSRCSFHVSSLH